MAFAQNWVEGDPDGSIITGSLLDDWIRFTKVAVRERMEGDVALNLTGLIETGTWAAGPIPKIGSARAWFVTAVNLGTVPLQDGRMAITTDTHRLYHMAGAGYYELDYLSKVAGGVVAGVITASGGVIGNLAGNATTATALATARTINGVNFDGTAAITVTAAAGTLTGAVLAAGVTSSSLTSVGTLTTLTVAGTSSFGGASDPVKIGNDTTYGIVSFNGVTSTVTALGIAGRTNPGEALYFLAPTGYSYRFSVNGVIVATISTAGVFNGNVVGNVTGAATTAGTVTTAAQPTITSVGTLTVLSVTGLITAPGGIDMTGIGATGFKGLVATGLGAAGVQATLTANVNGVGAPVHTAAQNKWLPIVGHDGVTYYVPAWI